MTFRKLHGATFNKEKLVNGHTDSVGLKVYRDEINSLFYRKIYLTCFFFTIHINLFKFTSRFAPQIKISGWSTCIRRQSGYRSPIMIINSFSYIQIKYFILIWRIVALITLIVYRTILVF